MKYHVVVTKHNSLTVEEFEWESFVDPELEYAQWIKKSGIEIYLRKHYPGYSSYDVTAIIKNEELSNEDSITG